MHDAAASVHGYWLNAARYGPETEHLVRAARERESWTAEQWTRWRDAELPPLLEHAARHVPFYRRIWQRRPHGADPRDLSSWPILEKRDLRENPHAFLTDGVDPRGLVRIHTSGTTGTPLTLWRSRATNVRWYSLFEARVREWYGVSRANRWANIGGQVVVATGVRRPPFWVWSEGLRLLYLSSYHLEPETARDYLSALRDHRIEYLLGYSSSLHSLAHGVLASGLADEARALRLRVAIANAEPVFPYQRDAVRAAFGCEIRETYGMAEIAVAASECLAGSLHEWPDAGVVELLDGDRAVPDGEAGDVVATCLVNRDMPLIRYRVGDRAVRARGDAVCECGRTLPRWTSVEGRIDDVLMTRDGRAIGRLDPVFKGDLSIVEAQIVQESLDRIVVRVVAAPGFSARDEESIASGVRERLGDVEVAVERVSEIPRSANGKFRAVVSRIAKP